MNYFINYYSKKGFVEGQLYSGKNSEESREFFESLYDQLIRMSEPITF